MKITYLLLAHHKPAQFHRLVATLSRDGDHVVAHIDAKADESSFASGAEASTDRITFVPERFDIRWGGFASVEAELTALKHALDVAAADYYILLSGVDYPIKRARTSCGSCARTRCTWSPGRCRTSSTTSR